MRVLHLIYDHMKNPWVGGGGAVRVYELCRRLAGKGHEVTVISGNYPGAKDYAEAGLSYRFLGSDRNYLLSTFSYACAAASFVRKHGAEFDIVIEDFAPWNPVFSGFLTKTPVVLHVNHKEGSGILRRWLVFGAPFYLIESFYPGIFKRVTALSGWTKRKIKRPDAVIVPAGINSIPEAVRMKEGYILYVGRLHIKNKGLDTLLCAMKNVRSKLVLVGRGRDEGRLRETARGLGLKDIEFRGFLSEEEKTEALLRAELFVLPSRFEGWGIVVLEAAACGTPVIVSDIPELSFAIEGGFGLSFRKGDPDDLASKINALLGDDKLRLEMGERARDYVKRYTWDGVAAEYEGYLKSVARGNGSDGV